MVKHVSLLSLTCSRMFSYTRLGWGERERLKGNQLRNGHASVNSMSVNLLYLHTFNLSYLNV